MTVEINLSEILSQFDESDRDRYSKTVQSLLQMCSKIDDINTVRLHVSIDTSKPIDKEALLKELIDPIQLALPNIPITASLVVPLAEEGQKLLIDTGSTQVVLPVGANYKLPANEPVRDIRLIDSAFGEQPQSGKFK